MILSFTTFKCNAVNKSFEIDGLKEQVRPEAETRIKSSLVLEQIAKDENIEVSEDEINAEIEKMAALDTCLSFRKNLLF